MKTIVGVNFTKFNTNKKDETVLEFQVRGELSDEQILALHKLKASGQTTICIASSQMDFGDVVHYPSAQQRAGLSVKINGDGTVDLDSKEDGQMTFEEAAEQSQEEADVEAVDDESDDSPLSDDSEETEDAETPDDEVDESSEIEEDMTDADDDLGELE